MEEKGLRLEINQQKEIINNNNKIKTKDGQLSKVVCLLDQVHCLEREHVGVGLRVGGRQHGQHRAVHHPQLGYPTYPQLAVHHRQGITAHLAAARIVVVGVRS